ncbi:glycosyltransferase family 39 protein [Cellulomonas wangsupingiae]|uniref:glycosyltransferase family 39 protein n=1 Tax=Cellulomonas wangsupingiae TaxID=2968085 RepID=UPI001D0E22A9|nr:glycosyltransferase family 39 protein [Cellulomonas wangsupingiae]MCM0640776.1 glycosyltransferase family 39 protein [Cellulomonas wangsupingiae]
MTVGPTVLGLRPRAAAESAPARVRSVRGAAFTLGALAVLVGFAGAWVPSAWGDEAATMSGALRDLPALLRLTTQVDAVHGVYYAVAHGWLALTGESVVALRLLSALAVGAAVAGTVVLADRLASRRVAVVAGLVLLALPRMTWAATEGRSAALATALAVWTTVALVSAVGAPRSRWRWVVYGALVAAGTCTWMLLALLPAAHLVGLLWWRRSWRALVAPAVAVVAGWCVAAPFLLVAVGQRGQVGWIPAPGLRTLRQVGLDQWFGTTPWSALPLALVCWSLVAVGVVTHLRRGVGAGGVVPLAAAWLVLPPLAAIAWSVVASPLYVPKYLAFTAPALALLVAVGVDALARDRARLVGVTAVVVLLAAPAWYEERTPTAKDRSDWADVADAVRAGAATGDAVVFSDLHDADGRVRVPARAIAVAYPGAFVGLRDVTRDPVAAAEGRLWDLSVPVSDAGRELAAVDRVWWVVDHRAGVQGAQREDLERLGFHVVSVDEQTSADVVLLEREG